MRAQAHNPPIADEILLLNPRSNLRLTRALAGLRIAGRKCVWR
jgi:hypothetical protein